MQHTLSSSGEDGGCDAADAAAADGDAHSHSKLGCFYCYFFIATFIIVPFVVLSCSWKYICICVVYQAIPSAILFF